MSSVHTPGPWTFDLDAHGRGRIRGNGCWVGTTWTVADDDTSKRYPAEANARLIAASPDLGAVLMRLARSADALLGACNAADVGDIDARKTACSDIADAHNVIQAAGLYGGGT